MVAGDGELAQGRVDRRQQGGFRGEVVELAVEQVAGGDQDIRLCFLHSGKNFFEPFLPDNEPQMHVRDLGDAYPAGADRNLGAGDLDVFQADICCLEQAEAIHGNHQHRLCRKELSG